jgi:hypothetical protein
MQLIPTNTAEGRLNPDLLRPYEAELIYNESRGVPLLTLEGRRLVSVSCWWDPAFTDAGSGQTGPVGPADGGQRRDSSVIAAVFGDGEGNFYLHRIFYLDVAERDQTDAATGQCRAVAGFVQALHIPAVHLEINGLGRFLPGLLRRCLAEAGIACAVVEVASRTSKVQRILEAFEVVLAAGALHAHRSIWGTPFIQEMRSWRPLGRAGQHDDGLDAVAGCLKSEPVRFGAVSRPLGRPSWRGRSSWIVSNEEGSGV